jgi:OOP family OmpA-OmpF porin
LSWALCEGALFGAPPYQELSDRRAAAVKEALVSRYGGDAARISAKGLGATRPIQENTTADGKAMNRRVEIVLAR